MDCEKDFPNNRRYRNRVEFKVYPVLYLRKFLDCRYRNRVEFKVFSHGVIKKSCHSRYRNRVEFKV